MARASADQPAGGELYRSLFDEMLEGFALHEIICDEAGKPVDYRFLQANRAFEQLTGLKRNGILGRTVLEVLPATEPEWIERYGHVALTGEPMHVQSLSGALNRIFDVHAYSPAHGLFATLFIDVTESERTKQELERNERLYRAVVETSADGFWMLDREGTILAANETLGRMTGYGPDEMVGLRLGDLRPFDSAEDTAVRMAAIEREGSLLFESTLRAKDGTAVPVSVNAAFRPIDGGRFFTFFRDLTGRGRAEFILRARAELLDLGHDAEINDILRMAVDKAELLTGSSIGFFHLVDPDQEHLTLQAWSTNTLATMCTAEGAGLHYAVDEAGVWAESLRTRLPAIHNDYAHLPEKQGLPAGHAPVTRELVVPVLLAGRVVALMGVGNKTTDYGPDDVPPVEAMASIAFGVAMNHQTQREFERFFDLVPDLVCIVSADGRFRRVNRQWEQTLGFAASEMLSHHFLDFVHPDDLDATRLTFASQSGGEGVTGFINRYLAKDGTCHWLEWSASALTSEGLSFAVARDITTARLADEALHHSESRFRGLFENMVEGLAYCRMIYEDDEPVDWVYLEVNDAFEKQTGIVGAAGRKVSEVIPGIRAADPELFRIYARVASTGEPTRFEMFVESLGMWFDLSVYSPERDHFVAVFDVITERKLEEVAAAEREQRLQALLDNAPYGAHMYELMPDDRLVFTGYNARADEMLGIDHGLLLGKTLEEAFPGDVGTETPDAYRRVARDGGTWEVEQLSYHENEIVGVYELFAFSFGPNRVSAFFRDVTDLRRAEMELQAADEQLRGTVKKLADAIRTLKALSACNEALVRAQSEQVLLQDICDIAVEQGGYLMAWVGYAEHDEARTVRPVAIAGEEHGLLSKIVVTWDDSPTGNGAAGRAIKTGKPALVGHMDTDPYFAPWRDEVLAGGYRSVAAFPLAMGDGEVLGAVLFYTVESDDFDEEELSLLAELASDLSYGIETLRARDTRDQMSERLAQTNERLEGLLRQVTAALGRVVEARDPYTSGHEERVARLARQIAVEMRLGAEDIEAVEIAGFVHDIGKLSVPTEILTKPGHLSEAEFALIREHPKSGYDILKGIAFPWDTAETVLQHHERMDGSGYPRGLGGADILVPARILAVADVVEAMASHRPYRPMLGLQSAIEEIRGHPDLYDIEAAAACIRLYEAGVIEM